jgi:hypothetical protein
MKYCMVTDISKYAEIKTNFLMNVKHDHYEKILI